MRSYNIKYSAVTNLVFGNSFLCVWYLVKIVSAVDHHILFESKSERAKAVIRLFVNLMRVLPTCARYLYVRFGIVATEL